MTARKSFIYSAVPMFANSGLALRWLLRFPARGLVVATEACDYETVEQRLSLWCFCISFLFAKVAQVSGELGNIF
jgi:hypothetical protein